MRIIYPPLNVISRLLLSKSAGPKVIIISGFHCIWTLFFCMLLPKRRVPIIRRYKKHMLASISCMRLNFNLLWIELAMFSICVGVTFLWSYVNNMSPTYWVWHKADLLPVFCLISKCSKYGRKCSATKLDIGDAIANPFDGL